MGTAFLLNAASFIGVIAAIAAMGNRVVPKPDLAHCPRTVWGGAVLQGFDIFSYSRPFR